MNRVTNGNVSKPQSGKDKTKDWQLEILMEKLRSKSSQFKNFPDISKNVRMTMLDKRYALDSVEKSQHQKCLDTLQHSIKVTSYQSMIERLESLTRQLGLKFTVGPPVFISSDMFYLEILLEPTGAVKDVKVHHEGKEQQSCQELLNCLSRGDFTDFTAQLEGFASIYHLNAEKKTKEKAFTALQSLESDLTSLAQLQSFMKEPINLLHKSPVGVLERRRGGHPMKLTYFVSPYELLDVERAESEPLTVDTITGKGLGYSVTVCMESSAAHKLQTTTLMSVNRNINGKSTPTFSSLNSQNSAVIPACFVLRLNRPMPMCVQLVRQIQQLTEKPFEAVDLTSAVPLLSLIVRHSSDGKLDSSNNRGLFVTLPDQSHCYFMTENKNMDGVLVSSIPFTHPAHVSQILVILRQQALFNTIIGSCVRPNSRQDFENMTMFEISALSWTHITISLEHPSDESMATAEIDLTDITGLLCRVQSPGAPVAPTPDVVSELGTKILNRCFSIPITMRAVIKQWDKQMVRRGHYNGHENFSLPLGSEDPGGHKGAAGGMISEYGGLESKIKQEPSSANQPTTTSAATTSTMQSHQQNVFLNESMGANFPSFPPSEGVLSGMDVTQMLSGSGQTTDRSAAKRQHKRRATDEFKGSKRKAGDETDSLLETSSSDSTSRSTPISQQDAVSEMVAPNSALGFHSDLELTGLDPADLLSGTADKQGTEFDNIDDLGDIEDILAAGSPREHKGKSRDPTTTVSLLMELGDKTLVPPNVSITPIPSSLANQSSEKRSTIDIITITSTASTTLPSSITITPIASPVNKNDDRNRERKSSKNRSEEKSRLEKKRKRKRDDSPMGPPEKIPPKQDPLSKPVSVSIKPAESPPLATPTSPSMIRKFSASPTHNRSTVSVSGKLSPSLMKSGLKAGSLHHSPKHSPGHVSSSPKHSIPGISSPKSHGTSPKHPSTSGSGKPSMTTLKNAANSPSGKSGDLKSKSKESSRDKERKVSGVFGVGNSKLKASNVKVKPLEVSVANETTQDGLPSPGGSNDGSKSSNNPNSTRNRKASLSAIVDKLKSGHCDNVPDLGGGKSSGGRERSGQASGKLSSSDGGGKGSSKIGDTKNSEYMVKHSSDGMKITINKTRSKESGKTNVVKSSSGTNSPKTHTGLKPGVNSGPASKKPQPVKSSGGVTSSSNSLGASISSTNYGSLKSGSSGSGSSSKLSSGSKSSSGGNVLSKSSSKLSGSPKIPSNLSSSDINKLKDRPTKINKSSSEKSIFSAKDRKSSPHPDEIVTSKIDPYSPLIMEGFMKQLDKNFQIPKLSARSADDKKQPSKDPLNNLNRSSGGGGGSTVDTKIFDMGKNELSLPKYPLAVPAGKLLENSMHNNSVGVNNSTPMSLSGSSPKYKEDEVDGDRKKDPSLVKEDGFKMGGYAKQFAPTQMGGSEPLSLSMKSAEVGAKFVTGSKDEKKDGGGKKDGGDICLDYSNSSKSDLGRQIPCGP